MLISPYMYTLVNPAQAIGSVHLFLPVKRLATVNSMGIHPNEMGNKLYIIFLAETSYIYIMQILAQIPNHISNYSNMFSSVPIASGSKLYSAASAAHYQLFDVLIGRCFKCGEQSTYSDYCKTNCNSKVR